VNELTVSEFTCPSSAAGISTSTGLEIQAPPSSIS
jgi:hypothetical protein